MEERQELQRHQYKPVDLKKALLNKPKKSKISFKGIDDHTIQFIMPERSMLYEDYIVLSILAGGVCVAAYVTYWLAFFGNYGWFGYIFPVLVWIILIYAAIHEYHSFKERHIFEISNRYLTIKNLKKGKEKVQKIALDEIILIKLASFSLSVIYIRDEKEKEVMFMEYAERIEQQWLVLILRTIVYNVTNKVV